MLYSSVYIEFDPRPFFPAKPQRSDAVSVVSLFHYPTIPLPPGSLVPSPRLPSSPVHFAQFWGSVSPLATTLMDPLASANKRLALWLTRLDATLTRNIGGRVHFLLPQIFYASLATRLKFFPFIFLRTLLRIFATWQNSTPFFSSDSALFLLKRFRTLCQKPPGVGCCRQPKPNNFGHPALSVTIARPCVARRNPHALWAQERKVGSEVRE